MLPASMALKTVVKCRVLPIQPLKCVGCKKMFPTKMPKYTPNANMADHSVGRDELHESEASEASVFCFDNATPEKSFFVDGLVCFISLCLHVQVFEFLNATRRD